MNSRSAHQIASRARGRLRRWCDNEIKGAGRGRVMFVLIFFYGPIILTVIAVAMIALVEALRPEWFLNL